MHPAIGGDAAYVDDGLYVLPNYVPRRHDESLRTRLTAIAEGNTTELILLRGGSCTGKTRTAYQAVQKRLASWHIVQPRTLTALQALLEAGSLPTRTVLWLDDLHNLLDTEAGEETADGLLELLEAPGPAVMLATIWPEPHERLTSTPEDGARHRHPQAAALLRTAHLLEVPDNFSGSCLAAAEEEAAADASLAIALESAEDHQICQALAAGPDLLRHWRHASNPYGKALITAAIEARRLGHREPLSGAFLSTAAAGYLTASQRGRASRTWFEEAFAYALRPIKRVTSALRAVPGTDGLGIASDLYEVADYLEQAAGPGRTVVPASFWDAAGNERSVVALRVLAAGAGDRALYFDQGRLLHLCLQRTGESSDREAFAHFLLTHGFHDEAVPYFVEEASAGSIPAMVELALAAEQRGDVEGALAWHSKACEAGNERAFFSVYHLLHKHGRWDEAERWIRARAHEWSDAARQLAALLVDRGRLVEAEEVLWPMARDNAHRCRRDLIRMLHKAGRADRIQELFGPLATGGDSDAEEWLTAVASWDQPDTVSADATDRSSAEPREEWVLRRGMVYQFDHPGRPSPQTLAMGQATAAEDAGRPEEALAVLRAALPSVHWPFLLQLSGVLERRQRWAEALAVWDDLVNEGNPAAVSESARILDAAAAANEAEALIRTELLRGPGIGRWHGVAPSMESLTTRLRGSHREQEAAQAERYGLRPDGATMPPWQPSELEGPRPRTPAAERFQ
ncbi:tetratricopeptide repeat protein [Streptomyces sp. Tue6028]|uniref:tetratricopeptide repeat protein n=1 Tax=Streptomyces sp. Tue6028 TaxID=2036037 RepID=UPI003EBA05DC